MYFIYNENRFIFDNYPINKEDVNVDSILV